MPLVLLAIFMAGSTHGSAHIFSVCDVALSAQRLDGKIIRIHGILRAAYQGADFLDELIHETCPGVEIHVGTAETLGHAPPPAYRPNSKSLRGAQRVAEMAAAEGRDLSATIEGVFYVQKKEDYVPQRQLLNGLIIPPRHKWYPFALLIQSMRDVLER